VFAALVPGGFRTCFVAWVQEIAASVVGEVIAVDGKALCHALDQARRKFPMYMVSAWASAQHLTLGQVKTDDKSNEIEAIPRLLAILDIVGSIITIDAAGCQTAIAKQIIAQRADYVLSLKENQARCSAQP